MRGVVLDWAGTVVDYGCIGPAAVFVEAFATFGVDISVDEARRFMGMTKKEHVRRLVDLPAVSDRWMRVHGRPPVDAEVDVLYAEVESMMAGAVAKHAGLIPGALDAVAGLRAAGIRIGSTTGYPRPIMDALEPLAAQQGYRPDAVFCPADVPAGRPYPWMCYRNAIALEVYPMEAMIKIGDTLSDVEEGLNAGMWSVGLTCTGNELGLSEAEVAALTPEERTSRLDAIARRFLDAGAHFTAPGLWAWRDILDQVNQRLAAGDRP